MDRWDHCYQIVKPSDFKVKSPATGLDIIDDCIIHLLEELLAFECEAIQGSQFSVFGLRHMIQSTKNYPFVTICVIS